MIGDDGKKTAKKWGKGEKVFYLKRELVEHKAMLSFLSDFGGHYCRLCSFCQTTTQPWIHLVYSEILKFQQILFNEVLTFKQRPASAPSAEEEPMGGDEGEGEDAVEVITCTRTHTHTHTHTNTHTHTHAHRFDRVSGGVCFRECFASSLLPSAASANNPTMRRSPGAWCSVTCEEPATTRAALQAGSISIAWVLPRRTSTTSVNGGARSAETCVRMMTTEVKVISPLSLLRYDHSPLLFDVSINHQTNVPVVWLVSC